MLLVTEIVVIEDPPAVKNMEAADNIVMIEDVMTEEVVAIEAILVEEVVVLENVG